MCHEGRLVGHAHPVFAVGQNVGQHARLKRLHSHHRRRIEYLIAGGVEVADTAVGHLPCLQPILPGRQVQASQPVEAGDRPALRGHPQPVGDRAVLQIEDVGLQHLRLPCLRRYAQPVVPLLDHVLAEDVLGAQRAVHEHPHVQRVGAPQHRRVPVEQLLPVELGGGGYPVDLLLQLVYLLLNVGPVLEGKGVVGRLHGELAHPLEDGVNLLQRALGGLQHGYAVLGVARSLVEPANLRAQLL